MPKQKKGRQKTQRLTNFERAMAKAMGIKSGTPAEVRAKMQAYRKRANYILKQCDLVGDMSRPPKLTNEMQDDINRLYKVENLERYFAFTRNMTLGTWMNQKITYRISKEAMEYINGWEEIEKCDISMFCIVDILREYPVFVELPEGSFCQGFFTGITSFLTEYADAGIENSSALNVVNVVIQPDRAFSVLIGVSDAPISVYLSDYRGDEKDKEIIKILFYLWFIRKSDAFKVVLHKEKKVSGTYIDVLPLPYPHEILLDKFKQFITIGSCFMMYFLDRRNMIAEYEQEQIREKQYSGLYPCEAADEAEYEEILRYQFRKTVLDWERHRSIYQYDHIALESFYERYLDKVLLSGFPNSLTRYFPKDTIALMDKDLNRCSLLSIRPSQPGKNGGILILSEIKNSVEISIVYIPFDIRADNIDDARSDQDVLGMLCVLYHILTVYEKRAIKKYVKDTLTAGDPHTTQLIELPPTHPYRNGEYTASEEDKAVDHGDYHIGEDLMDTPFELFDITMRTVKRSDMSEVKRRTGWKMVPHIRRPHPHRYWVGTGADRHLETRWLERMYIHKDQEAEKATLHELM